MLVTDMMRSYKASVTPDAAHQSYCGDIVLQGTEYQLHLLFDNHPNTDQIDFDEEKHLIETIMPINQYQPLIDSIHQKKEIEFSFEIDSGSVQNLHIASDHELLK